MKKQLLIAIIGAVAIFLAGSGICYAVLSGYTYDPLDSIDPNGTIYVSMSPATIDFDVYSGFYPDDTTYLFTWTGNVPASPFVTTMYSFSYGLTGDFYATIYNPVDATYFYYSMYCSADCNNPAGTGWSETGGEPNPTITITSPASGTTITDVATNLVGTWSEIDPDIYHNITLYFNSNFIGEQSVAKNILVDDWTGNFTIPLSYFGLSANGQWDLKGNATFANTQLSDMYITTDLISPAAYNLIFNVEGFHTPFTFTDFDTWYDANVSNYASPSAWASGMIGYLQPILEKIAEFGARLQDYLNTSTAWQRGNDIGSVFPVINAYILKINMFFGGFPIAQFFQWGSLIMMGIFAIKIILKLLSFIPVIGGGG